MPEVTFLLPSEAVFTLAERELHRLGRRFGMRPSQLLLAILQGRIAPIPQTGCRVARTGDCQEQSIIVSMDAPEDAYERASAALKAWREAHPEQDFGDFVLNLALGHYDLVEAPRQTQRDHGHRPPTPRCRVCGRPLRSPEAIARGVGPVCEAKLQTRAA